MNLNNQKVGVIGGSQGLGQWLVNYLSSRGVKVSFSSSDENTQYMSNEELVKDVDVVILAVPINVMEEVLEEIFPFMDQKVLIEICSVKKFMIEKFHELKYLHPQIKVKFCSIHPMFGPRINTLKGNVILFTHSNDFDEAEENHVREFFEAGGAETHLLDYIKHDKLMGIVQGLNHFNVFVSAKTLARYEHEFDDVKLVASPPYRIFIVFFTRYVLQNPKLYADIQMSNEYVFEVVRVFRDEMNKLFDIIQTKDRNAFINYIEEMQQYFLANKEDREVSSHLIQQLGEKLSSK